jgi:hypothetical protein
MITEAVSAARAAGCPGTVVVRLASSMAPMTAGSSNLG